MSQHKTPQFATYVSQCDDVNVLLHGGYNELCIDLSELSIGAQQVYNPDTSFDTIALLAEAIRQSSPQCLISISMDILYYDSLEELCKRALAQAKKVNIKHFRVQDIGMAALIHECIDDAQIMFTPLIGSANAWALQQSVQSASLAGISYPIEMDHGSIVECTQKGLETVRKELLVQGPILLQYSPRRMLSAARSIEMQRTTTPLFNIESRDQNKRKCFFHDCAHGLLMYAGNERSLIKKIPQLAELHLDTWFFDCRSAAVHAVGYAVDALQCFKDEYATYKTDAETWVSTPDIYTRLQGHTGKKQHPGFFSRNKTDTTDFVSIKEREDRRDVGVVLDVIREKALTIELFEGVLLGDLLEFRTPEGRVKKMRVETMKDLYGTELKRASEGDIIRIAWTRSVVVTTRVLKL